MTNADKLGAAILSWALSRHYRGAISIQVTTLRYYVSLASRPALEVNHDATFTERGIHARLDRALVT